MSNRWVTWDEPFGEHENRVCFITEKDAIAVMKTLAAKRNSMYLRDQDALEDFLTIHYAWLCEAPNRTVLNDEGGLK